VCRTPTLLISSAKDRLLGSLKEGARLERVLSNAMRVVLPKSGHTALLEVPHALCSSNP
jgi:pimeloyl-ACP methyl ester carboxylesterase